LALKGLDVASPGSVPPWRSERIQALKEENATLHRRIEELEERLTAPSTDGNASRWEEEKREIRERVERLTKTLEDVAGV